MDYCLRVKWQPLSHGGEYGVGLQTPMLHVVAKPIKLSLAGK
jgi:hypothetical protein